MATLLSPMSLLQKPTRKPWVWGFRAGELLLWCHGEGGKEGQPVLASLTEDRVPVVLRQTFNTLRAKKCIEFSRKGTLLQLRQAGGRVGTPGSGLLGGTENRAGCVA